jgi:hypothetical protein
MRIFCFSRKNSVSKDDKKPSVTMIIVTRCKFLRTPMHVTDLNTVLLLVIGNNHKLHRNKKRIISLYIAWKFQNVPG